MVKIDTMRGVMTAAVSGAAALLVSLVALALFVQFPQVLTTGDAHLQRWIGPNAARLSFFGLALLVGGGAIWVAWTGTRARATQRAWRIGASAGAVAGLVVAFLYIITAGVATSSEGLQVPRVFSLF